MSEQERGFNPLGWTKDQFEKLGDQVAKIEAAVERRVQIKLALRVVNIGLSDLKDLDPDNAALYADLQAELAARK